MTWHGFLRPDADAYGSGVEIDPDALRAPYEQLADILRARIESGEIPPGHRIPSYTALEAESGLARGTVRKALQVLKDAGLIATAPGRGLYVRDQADNGKGGGG
jgi:DNA-binding GntR family transcriptional regulator